jgi:hypothetical protein
MSFSLKPRLFLTGFLPGFLFLIGVLVIYKQYKPPQIWLFCRNMSLPSGIGIVILSFIVGQVFDSVRDWGIERIHSRCFKADIYWQYFSKASTEDIEKLDDNFYIWYVLNYNLAISMFAVIALVVLDSIKWLPVKELFTVPWIVGLLGVSIFFLIADAYTLRKDVSEITSRNKD